jgi:hypothetical protein
MRGRITPNKKVSSPTLCSSSGYSAENTAIVTPTAGACKTGFTLTELGAEGKEGKAVRAHAEGSMVVIEPDRIRVRGLPLIP